MKTPIIAILLILFWGCSSEHNEKLGNQPLESETLDFDAVLNDLSIKMNDSNLFEEEREAYIGLVEIVKSIKNSPEEIFPYSDFDSVIFISYSKIDEFILPLEEREVIYKASVSIVNAQKLLNVINNPLNYSSWECGTKIPSERLIFFLYGKQIAELQFACAYGVVIPIPENKLIWGGFDINGDSVKTIMDLKITKHNKS